MRPLLVRHYLLALACSSFCVLAHSDQPQNDLLGHLDFSNRSLGGLIALYQRSGLEVIFSDALVARNMIVQANPREGDSLDRLAETLGVFGLKVEYDPVLEAWQILNKASHYVDLVFRSQGGIKISGVEVRNQRTHELITKSDDDGRISGWHFNSSESYYARHRDFDTLELSSDAVLQGAVVLEPKTISLEEIVVVGNHYAFGSMNFQGRSKTSTDLQLSPSQGGDPFRILNTIPGVSLVGVSSQPSVRGSLQGESIIKFDGVELMDPYHLKDFHSLISAINNEAVGGIEVYTGGFPVNYGNGIGGVIEIHPNVQEHRNHAFSANFLNTAISTGATGKGVRWNLFSRRGNLDEVLDNVNNDIGDPNYYDINAIARWDMPSSKFRMGYLKLNDHVTFQSLDDGEGEFARSKYDSNYFWGGLNAMRNGIEYDLLTTVISVKNSREGSITEPDNPDESNGYLFDDRSFLVGRLELDAQAHTLKNNLLKFGGKAEWAEGNYHYETGGIKGGLATLLGESTDLNNLTNINLSNFNLNAYASSRYSFSDALLVEGGIRWDSQFYDSNSEYQLSPRVSVLSRVTNEIELKLNAGKYFQVADINEYQPELNRRDHPEPQQMAYYSLGMEYIGDTVSANYDVYYKSISSLPERAENLFNPYGLLPELSPDRVNFKPEKAYATGLDSYVHYKSDSWAAWVSYSYSDVYEMIAGKKVNRRWNNRHAFKAGGELSIGPVEIVATVQYRSGWLATRLPYSSYEYTPAEYRINNQTLPSISSFDLKASYLKATPSYSFSCYLELINVFNKKNIGSYEIEIEKDESQYNLSYDEEPLFGLIPNIGVKIMF